MKQKLHIFMTLLLLVICGGVSFGQTTETFKFSSFTTPKESISFDGENCTITLTKGTNPPFWSTSKKEARVYAKGSLVVTSDLKITKIVYTFADNGGTFGSVTPSGYDESTKTWSSVNGSNEVTFNIGGTKGNYGFTQLEITYAGSDKTSTKLSFGADYDGKTITKNIGDIYEALATLTPAIEGATITYKSSDDAVAEVDGGTVLTKKEGTATITASYAGDDTYAASSASYTLNVVDGRTATTLTFPNASYTFTEGDQDGTAVIEDNVAVLSPEGAGKVTYSVSGTDGLASVEENGSVLVDTKVVGTATITATFAGNDNYKASEASYTIEVVKKAGQVEDGVFDFTGTQDYGSGLTPRNDYGNTEYDSATKWTAGNVTINTLKGNGNGARWWKADENQLRVYANSKLTVSVPDGYFITNIDLGVYGKMNVDCGTLNNSKWTGASQTVTITPTARKDFKNITVKYTKCETLTTAASGFSTYAADYDVDYSAAGLKAYAITLDEAAKTVKYTEATGVVPAGKAVLVKGEANKEYTLAPATEAAGEFTTDLQISDGTVTTEGGLYYAFATVDGKSGFKKLANGMTIPAKKGYLKLSAASAKGFFELDDTTTGIKGISEDIIDEEETPLFNLAGQRVSKSYKGVVVKNGKKFVNK